MKYIIVLLATAFLSVCANDYYDKKVVIKIKNNTSVLRDLSDSKKNEVFDNIFKEYQIEYYTDDKLLGEVDKKYNRNAAFRNSLIESNPLRRIFIISYEQNFDPRIISDKIKTYDFVEYAEPLFRHNFVDYPNDLDYDRLYHIPQVKADSAWTLTDTAKKVILGVVDTGVDYLHDDLFQNIYINMGEIGTDEDGNPKESNGIDDDGNGFADDWRGWDFASGDSLGQDNDPAPGSNHGTHVAGTAAAVINNLKGVAGVADNALILPVKIGPDAPSSRSTVNSYDGILYAAIAGADVINCSWGSSNFSDAENDIIKEAMDYGSIIVAASGNDRTDGAFYPAAYDGVISVAAVDSTDKIAWFSNYHYSVDVSAPGVDIFSTVPNSVYQRMSGTSMASPVAAGVVCMLRGVYPDLSPVEISERLKATADNIDTLNPAYAGKIGTGRVNAYRAVAELSPKNVYVENIVIDETVKDNEFSKGEEINITLELKNYLSDIDNLGIGIYHQFGGARILKDTVNYGYFPNNEEIEISDITLNLPEDSPYNFKFNLVFEFYEYDNFINSAGTGLIMNNSYKTFDGNKLTVTAASQGNLCYNDFPANAQGEGFRYESSNNLSYEGALMIARDTFLVSNVARGSAQSAKNRAFDLVENMTKFEEINMQTGSAAMEDDPEDTTEVGVKVITHVTQPVDSRLEDVIFVSYDIINLHNIYKDSIFAGLYFDWDIGPDVHNNKIYYDYETQSGICINTESDTVPLTGMKIISDNPINFFAIDNDGNTDDNPGVYDGFTYREKWQTLSGGIKRDESNITDASVVMSAGPLTLLPEDTTRVTFALFAGESENHLKQISELIDDYSGEFINADGDFISEPKDNLIELIYPNPNPGNQLNIKYKIESETEVSMDIIDISGKRIERIIDDKHHFKGTYILNYKPGNIADGTYFVRLKTNNHSTYDKFIFQK